MAKCPAHADNNPSLSITETDTGNVLLYCFAGCPTPNVIDALELEFSDLFPTAPARTRTEHDGKSFKAAYYYYDQTGNILYRVVKYKLPDGRKTFRQQAYQNGGFVSTMGNTQRVLYNLPQITRAIDQYKPIWIVEGEKDAETLRWLGPTATCNPGGADNGSGTKFTDHMIHQLDNAGTIVICIDNDPPGEQHARYLYQRLARTDRHITIFRPTMGKDISEHIRNGGDLTDLELIENSQHPTGWAELETITPDELDALDDDPNLNGWWPVDIASILATGYHPPTPQILERIDGQHLLYTGRINSLFGESGSGKSWIALLATAQQIQNHKSVIYIDLEDHIGSIIERLTLLGCTHQQLIDHLHYLAPFATADLTDLDRVEQLIHTNQVTLCVFDSVGEAMALGNTDPNADEQVARWFRTYPRRFANAGACIILNDHQPKNTDNSSLFAIGSQRKKAAIDGIAYRVVQKKPFARNQTGGEIELHVAKDRAGTFPTKSIAAIAMITSTMTSMNIELHEGRDTLLDTLQIQIQKIVRALEAADRCQSANQLGKQTGMHRNTVEQVCQTMIDMGLLEIVRASRWDEYRLARPYLGDLERQITMLEDQET